MVCTMWPILTGHRMTLLLIQTFSFLESTNFLCEKAFLKSFPFDNIHLIIRLRFSIHSIYCLFSSNFQVRHCTHWSQLNQQK